MVRSSMPRESARHRIAVLAMERVQPMEVGIPFQIFDREALPYDVVLCARRAGPVDTMNGWQLIAPWGLDALETADTVIVPAFRDIGSIPEDVASALRQAHSRGARMVSICAGAFALANAGLLDGRRATTHWIHAARLARQHPEVVVDPDALYVDEGDVVTSAGVSSGIDLCLHLLRQDHGAAVANAVARDIVAAPRREGGQAQFIPKPAIAANEPSSLAPTLEWALARLELPLTVADFARHARMSSRTFARVFGAATGTTPLKWLNSARIDRARELLETSDLPVDQLAPLCGLGTPTNLRIHFRRVTGTTPSAYRRTFRADE
ncbi:DJ-1/PfpI family protein [Microbacterium sp. KUDC0406]|uniref:GlxA family transcriptional regulator n=1 Tax=Microbacterium sp. KUDC0406 TaxID=2909588 RepID=UPI001F30B3F5|nr:helix-turn-helix domain-containing protein [Microbacterium sp. KUDC0406]UJP10340.1 DJ-1/PfpI family protein [Microbacterium sp. KUDC0406]